jgi:hypothetical protein
MTNRSKQDQASGTPSVPGNVSSPGTSEQPQPWSKEDMAVAKPLPLPTVAIMPNGGMFGNTKSGKGETIAGGHPEP